MLHMSYNYKKIGVKEIARGMINIGRQRLGYGVEELLISFKVSIYSNIHRHKARFNLSQKPISHNCIFWTV